ncbi:alpha-glucosidase [Sphingomonas kaistensis]|uniref:Alpha-glucosidase n=1 Tax=Sphingomonas kaistensis TaxID=298708 RepID=A0A7X5Y326_9SPHN|nr:alpha-amylase family glycosyl hydrolase [Sphingomonas kaistensis]NJC04276.1 alpha-glucosidase [Sphingomonas kaistensis]
MSSAAPFAEPPVRAEPAAAEPWWRGATIYQIYPRSFCDSDGDGIGDLRGITARLTHVADLGVDAVWVSPFFTSPMKDFGYDVADYRDVDPIFGTLADFDALIARAHALGLKVLIDLVFSHTSDQHRWFVESRSSRTNDKADWYVWADPKPDGSPPSNWQSVFGGPSWTWDARREQYYHHNFLKEQPQLNGHHPAVQQALLDIVSFWLDRGVDGFRFDAVNFMMHDPRLTDNPPVVNPTQRTRPFDLQHHFHNQSQPEILPFLERLRALCDDHGAAFALAEVGGEQAREEMADYTAPGRLHSAYGFDFLYADRLTPALVAESAGRWPDRPGMGWPSWAFENHDAPRALSRWVDEAHAAQFARTKLLLLAALRGSIILYQGEELGLTQVEVPFELLQDPEAIANWPQTLSRDGVRTPMPWSRGEAGLGFTSGTPWLPFGADHTALSVDAQAADPESLLHLTRSVIALRNAHQALRWGSLDIVEAGEQRLVFDRLRGGQRLRCSFNLSADPAAFAPVGTIIFSTGDHAGGELGPFAAVIEEF